MGSVVRAVFSYKHLRRGPGQSGALKRYVVSLSALRATADVRGSYKTDASETSTYMYLSPTQELTPWTPSMVVQVRALWQVSVAVCADWVLCSLTRFARGWFMVLAVDVTLALIKRLQLLICFACYDA